MTAMNSHSILSGPGFELGQTLSRRRRHGRGSRRRHTYCRGVGGVCYRSPTAMVHMRTRRRARLGFCFAHLPSWLQRSIPRQWKIVSIFDRFLHLIYIYARQKLSLNPRSNNISLLLRRKWVSRRLYLPWKNYLVDNDGWERDFAAAWDLSCLTE